MHGAEVVPKYALDEIERRWLVDAAAVGDLSAIPFRLYEDLYFANSRLRLRRITESDGRLVHKLGKKYGKRTPLSEPMTTLYLDATEFNLLRSVQGHQSTKRRYALFGGSLDVYIQPNAGLMIFELEFASEGSAAEYQPPPVVTREITNEPAYSGFQISKS